MSNDYYTPMRMFDYVLNKLGGGVKSKVAETPDDIHAHAEGTAFSDFAHGEVADRLGCCESPDPHIESSEMPDREMGFAGVCGSCGEDFGGVVELSVTVATEAELK